MLRRSLAIALLAAAAAGCVRGDGIDPQDLPGIVLQAHEAPAGTREAVDVGGEQDLDAFARDAVERAALVRDGFVAGYVVYFAPEAWFDPTEPVGDDAVAFQAIAGLFGDDDGASSSLHRYLDDLRNRQLEDAEDLEVPELGDESFGLRGSAPADGSALLVYLVRVGNLILVASGSGPVDEGTVAAAARAMVARAG